MDNMTRDLIAKLAATNQRELESESYFETVVAGEKHRVTVFEVKTDEVVLKFWNTSNTQGIYCWNTLKDAIIASLVYDNWSANDLSDGWNHWMYEVEEL